MILFRRACFTLLELLVVLFIVSMGVVLTGVKIQDFYQEQRFTSESQQVLNQLTKAQDLMLIMDADVEVKMTLDPEKKGLKVQLQVEKPLEPVWKRLIEREILLTSIRSFEFDQQSENELILQFSLGRMSQGTLVLSDRKEKSDGVPQRTFEIGLMGYPSPIGAPVKEEHTRKKVKKSELLYPTDVYEEMYKEARNTPLIST